MPLSPFPTCFLLFLHARGCYGRHLLLRIAGDRSHPERNQAAPELRLIVFCGSLLGIVPGSPRSPQPSAPRSPVAAAAVTLAVVFIDPGTNRPRLKLRVNHLYLLLKPCVLGSLKLRESSQLPRLRPPPSVLRRDAIRPPRPLLPPPTSSW